MNHKKTTALFCVFVLAFAMVSVESAFAGKDTPDSLMTVYKDGSADSADLVAASTDANLFLNRVATDKAYATKLLEAIQKKDTAAITTLARQVATRSSVAVENINSDFSLTLSFTVKGHKVHACASSDQSCAGHSVIIKID